MKNPAASQFQTVMGHADTRPDSSLEPVGCGSLRTQVVVVFTSVPGTRAALDAVYRKAADRHTRILLLIPEVVPFPLELDHPAVPSEFVLKRAWPCFAPFSMPIDVQVFFCRDVEQAVLENLEAPSRVVVGGSRRWCWPTRAQRLARLLRRHGHEVDFVEAEG